jgi:hypothetical protein
MRTASRDSTSTEISRFAGSPISRIGVPGATTCASSVATRRMRPATGARMSTQHEAAPVAPPVSTASALCTSCRRTARVARALSTAISAVRSASTALSSTRSDTAARS